jgi:PknH-like extracellular domain
VNPEYRAGSGGPRSGRRHGGRRAPQGTGGGGHYRPRSRWWFAAPFAAVMLVAGCSGVVDGTARPAANLAARPLTGPTIKQVLLGDSALSRILNQSFRIDPRFPPRFGGPETLQDDGYDSPVDCLGVASMLQQVVYQSGKVTHVAVETWRQAAVTMEVTDVREGVVSLPTAADANALFAEFSRQWRKCDGTTALLPESVFRLKAKTTNVQISDSVVAATVSIGWASPTSDEASIPSGRAVGVRGNCLVEVEVDFFNRSSTSHRWTGDLNAAPIDIAHAMMDKIRALS